jgi:hypothetical protein
VVSSTQAYDTLLQPADPPLRDRSEEAARRTRECAQALLGSLEGESFGWHRREKRERLLDDQLTSFLWQSGFLRLPDDMMMAPYTTKPFWWRPLDDILVGDCNPENYSRITDDIIVPIDVISHPFPRSLLAQTAFKNGLSLDQLIQKDQQLRQQLGFN